MPRHQKIVRPKPILFIENLDPYIYSLALFDHRRPFAQYLDWVVGKVDPEHVVPKTTSGRFWGDEDKRAYAVGCFTGDFGCLVHEIGHVAIHLFEVVGIPIRHETAEAFTYFQTSLFQRCRDALNDHAAKR